MITIRPISDLRNKFSEVEADVLGADQPVFLTKNGYGSMVVMSLEHYAHLTESLETKLDQADDQAMKSTTRYTADQVFGRIRRELDEGGKL